MRLDLRAEEQVVGLDRPAPRGDRPGHPGVPAPARHVDARPARLGLRTDRDVRLARLDEVGLVVPAAAHMFTEEIGYPPYFGSDAATGPALQPSSGRDTPSSASRTAKSSSRPGVLLALGGAQVQGVWVHPRLRGQGLAVPAMAAVLEHILGGLADEVLLYVNDANIAARATYASCGFREVGAFTTVLL